MTGKSSGTGRLWLVLRELGALVFLVVLCAVLWVKAPGFRDPGNIIDVLVQISGIAIAAAGMTFIIVSGGIDLSVGSTLAFAGCVGALVSLSLDQSASSAIAVSLGFLAALGAGGLAGLANGLLITRIPLPPFIATLGIMSLVRGLAYKVANNSPVPVTDGLRQVALAKPFGLPFPIILMAVVYVVAWILLRRTRLGRYSYAIGGNEQAARLSGVRVNAHKLVIYTIGGMLAAISGLIVGGRLAWMQPQEGDGFELDVIAAAVIGGTSLSGGEGSIVGTFLGALIMGVVRNGLSLMAVDYNLQKIAIGSIIVIAVSADVLVKRYGRKN